MNLLAKGEIELWKLINLVELFGTNFWLLFNIILLFLELFINAYRLDLFESNVDFLTNGFFGGFEKYFWLVRYKFPLSLSISLFLFLEDNGNFWFNSILLLLLLLGDTNPKDVR